MSSMLSSLEDFIWFFSPVWVCEKKLCYGADSDVIVERTILKRCLEALNKVEYGKFKCLQGFGSCYT